MFWCFDISRHSMTAYSPHLSKLGQELRGSTQFRLFLEYIIHFQKDNSHLHIIMQDDLIDAYYVCIKKEGLVERVAKKVSIQIITLEVGKKTLSLSTQGL